MNDNTAPNAREHKALLLLAVAMVVGLMAASVRAWTWSDVQRSRNLIVVAPPSTQITIVDGPAPIDDTHGVHTWSVMPGPILLEVVFPGQEQSKQQTKVVIPKGLGGLMLKVSPAPNGELVLGYF
jgi:hypothetical protein